MRAQRQLGLSVERQKPESHACTSRAHDARLRFDRDAARQLEVDLDRLADGKERVAGESEAADGDVLAASAVIRRKCIDERRGGKWCPGMNPAVSCGLRGW